jgi:translation initiation factor eIF-2B subunit alpha
MISTLLSSLDNSSAHDVSVAHITTSASTPPKSASYQSMPATNLPIHELAYALSSLLPSQLQHAIFVVSATAVLENGGIIAPLGTQQLAMLAQAHGIPFYVAVESFKFVREFPLGCGEDDLRKMGVRQPTLVFSGGEGEEPKSGKADKEEGKMAIREETEKVDVTAPYLISALITENGTMTPSAVSEELVKLWY